MIFSENRFPLFRIMLWNSIYAAFGRDPSHAHRHLERQLDQATA
jgi:hypothetical protein